MTKVIDSDEMHKILNEFSNEINELKNEYLVGKDKKIGEVIENTLLVYNNYLKFIDDYILKNHQRTPMKQISSETLLKTGSTSSPFSIQFPSQETIAERVNLKPRERKKNRNRIKNFNFKRTIY